jgi:hypothetical protein
MPSTNFPDATRTPSASLVSDAGAESELYVPLAQGLHDAFMLDEAGDGERPAAQAIGTADPSGQ